MLLSRDRAKFSRLWGKVKIAAGIADSFPRTNFGLTTPTEEIAAVRSKNEFLEVPCSIRFHIVQILYGYNGVVTDLCLFFLWIEVSGFLIPECLSRRTIAARIAFPVQSELWPSGL